MRYFIINSLAVTTIFVGALVTAPPAAGFGADECQGTQGVCEGETCCVDGETGSCYTGEELCTALFCEDHPESSLCEEGITGGAD